MAQRPAKQKGKAIAVLAEPALIEVKPESKALQFAFWEALFGDANERTVNQIALYDLAPRFVQYTSAEDRMQGAYLRMVEKDFVFGDQKFRLTLRPARIRSNDGVERDEFPSEREQIVEQVIRRIAMKPNRLEFADSKRRSVRVTFTLYEIQRDLIKSGRTLGIAEIREAIEILHFCNIEITSAEGKAVVSAPAFPFRVVNGRDTSNIVGDEERTHVQLNPLVSAAILDLTFRQVSYDTIMKIRDPVSRWVYRRLVQEHVTRGEKRRSIINASTIARDSGLVQYARWRQALTRISRAVNDLVGVGVLDSVAQETIKESRKISDIQFVMTPSESFRNDLRHGDRKAETNRKMLAEQKRKRAIPDNGMVSQMVLDEVRLDLLDAHAVV